MLAEVRKPKQLSLAIAIAKREGARVVAIGGGDGTLRRAATDCLELGLPMAMIPTGTGNAFAREHGVPLDPVKAVEFLTTTAVEKQIDVGYCNKELFLTTATAGLSARIGEKLQQVNKGLLGRLAYLPAVLRACREARPFPISIETSHGNFEGRIHQFVAAASRTHAGPFRATLDSENDDGLLSIYAVEADANMSLLRYGISLLRGVHAELDHVWCLETTKANVATNRTRTIVLDGDRYRAKTFRLRIKAKALTIFAAPA